MSMMICNDNEIWAIYSDPCSAPVKERSKRHPIILELIAAGFGIGVFYMLIVLLSVL